MAAPGDRWPQKSTGGPKNLVSGSGGSPGRVGKRSWPTNGPRLFRVIYKAGSITNCTKQLTSGHPIRPGTLFREGVRCIISGRKIQGNVINFLRSFASSTEFQLKQTWGNFVSLLNSAAAPAIIAFLAHYREGIRSLSPPQLFFFSSVTLVDAISQSARPY